MIMLSEKMAVGGEVLKSMPAPSPKYQILYSFWACSPEQGSRKKSTQNREFSQHIERKVPMDAAPFSKIDNY
jgi:hypothetical protein